MTHSIYRLPGSFVLPYKGVSPVFGDGAFLASGASAIGDLVAGVDLSLWFNTVVRADCHYIRIGDRVNIQDNTVVHVTNSIYPTIIEDEVSIGHSAVIHGCTIGRGCLIGMGAVVMDGVQIGEQSLVAAGALVPPGKSFPPRSLIRGHPAKFARELEDKELEMLERTCRYYLEYKKNYAEPEAPPTTE